MAVGLAFFSGFHAHVFQHGGDAPARLRIGDARAHHACAQDAHFLRLVARCSLGSALAALDAVHVEEEGVDHVARHLAGHETGEVTAFDAHGGVKVHHRAFDHGGQRRFGRGVQTACFLLEHGRRHAEHARDLGVAGRAAGHFVVLAVPHMLGGFGLALRCSDESQCAGAQLIVTVHQLMHQAQLDGFVGAKELAFQHIGLRGQQTQYAGHLGDATTTGDQAQRDFGQSELGFGVAGGDAVVADQRHFPATAQRRAIQAADHGHAQRLDGAETFLDAFDLGKNTRAVRGLRAHHALEVCPRKKRRLGRSQDDALELGLVFGHLLGRLGQVGLPLQAHGVDRRALLVKGDGGDAVRQFVAQCFQNHVGVSPIKRVQRWWQCPCRRPHTKWPSRSAVGGGAARRSGCPKSSRPWPPAGGPWRSRHRSR